MRALICTLMVAAGVAAGSAAGAADDGRSYRFDITEQSLGQALRSYAQISGQEIIFVESLFEGARPVSLKGDYTAEAALDELLKGTNLVHERSPSGAIVIRRAGTDGGTATTTDSSNANVAGAASGSSDTAGLGGLEEVIVTAQKRQQRLQDVPAAISALTGQTFEAMGAESFTDYARSIPGLTFQDSGAGRQIPTIRGIKPSAGAPAVAYYIDETPMPANLSFVVNPRLTDVARVEVLRGPQGTLYGSSSIGGTIKLIPNAPDLSEVSASVQATAMVTDGADGSSLGGDTELVLNLPVVEGVAALRGAFWGSDVGGYINRTYGLVGDYADANRPQGTVGNHPDERSWGFRVSGLFQATEQLELSAMAYVQNQHFNGLADITGGPDNPNDRPVQHFLADVDEPQNNRFELYNLTAKYDLGNFSLVSSSSYNEQSFDYSTEGMSAIQLFPTFLGDPPSGAAFPNVAKVKLLTHAFTQELRLATSQPIAGFDVIVGGYYSTVDQANEFYWSPPQYNAALAGNDPTNPLYAPDDNILTAWGPGEEERQVAAFGELTYHISDALRVTGGLRYYDVKRDEDLFTSGWFVGGNEPGVVDEALTSSDSDGFVYKGNVSYDLTSDHLVYAQYSEGFRRGFGNRPLPDVCGADAQLEVKPDSIKNYELGLKSDWLDRRLTVNAAAYRIDWDDIQQGVILPCGFSLTTNFGSAEITGGELEINSKLSERVSAGASGTYLRTRLQQDVATLGALEGDRIQYVPEWQFAAYVETSLPLFEEDDGFARLDYQYTGSSFANYNHLEDGTRDPDAKMDVTRLVNMRAGLRRGNWEFAIAGQNLFNERARQSLDANSIVTFVIPGRPRYVLTRPRTFALSVSYQF